jgi:hypothetical protein
MRRLPLPVIKVGTCLAGLTLETGLCFYAFMRTTIELPTELLKRAKAEAVARGESLKSLFTKAIAAEVGSGRHHAGANARVKLPVFGDPNGSRVAVTNADIEKAFSNDEADHAQRFGRARKR